MKCSALCRSQLFWLNRRKCIQLANLQLLWKASQLFLAISDLVWSGKLHPSPWPRGGGRGEGGCTEYRRGSKLAEMWFQSQKFSMCRAAGLRLFIKLHDWDGGSSCGTLALIWRENSWKRSTYGCTDPSTRPGTDWRLKIIISPRGMERTRSILLPWSWFSVNCTCGWHFIYWKRLHGIVLSAQAHLYSLCVHSLDKYESRKLVVCIIRACSTRECFFHLLFLHPLHPIAHMHDSWPGCALIKMLYTGLATPEWYDLEANLSVLPVHEKPVQSQCLLFIYEQV